MAEQLVGTVTHGNVKADIYSLDLPGEFKVIYRDSTGAPIEETPLTGISTYKQREPEIFERLRQLSEGARPRATPDRGDAGEY